MVVSGPKSTCYRACTDSSNKTPDSWGRDLSTGDQSNVLRSRGWADIERVIVRQTGKLDWYYIHEQLRPLAELKEAPEILDQLEARRVEFER